MKFLAFKTDWNSITLFTYGLGVKSWTNGDLVMYVMSASGKDLRSKRRTGVVRTMSPIDPKRMTNILMIACEITTIRRGMQRILLASAGKLVCGIPDSFRLVWILKLLSWTAILRVQTKFEQIYLLEQIMKIKLGIGFICFMLMCLMSKEIKASPTDSIGTKIKKGYIFILHKVEAGQGLYSVSRRYNVPLDKIVAENPGVDQGLKVDQVLLIPTGKKAPAVNADVKKYLSEEKPKEPMNNVQRQTDSKTTFGTTHVVKKGETLYSISSMYNTKPEVLISLNNLEGSTLAIGQKLLVPGGQSSSPDEKEARLRQGEERVHGASDSLARADDGFRAVEGFRYTRKVEYVKEYDVEKISEKGTVGDLSSAEPNTRVGSHHSAAIGSTVMVLNPENKKAVFVRIIANHELGSGSDEVIKLSPSALQVLAMDKGGKIELSYAK
jgi:LysM repeat protein